MIKMCEHKTVLAIYQRGKPHTKRNVAHFRCVYCGKVSVNPFGTTIYEKPMNKLDSFNVTINKFGFRIKDISNNISNLANELLELEQELDKFKEKCLQDFKKK